MRDSAKDVQEQLELLPEVHDGFLVGVSFLPPLGEER